MKKNKKKVSIIGTNGLPGRYGGWDQLLNNLTVDLKDRFDFIVYTSSFNAVEGLTHVNSAKLRIVRLKANGIQSIPYDILSMLDAVFKRHDVLLIMGVSGCIFLPFIKPFTKKIILNIDGAEWKRGKWNRFAKWFLKLSEKWGVKYADIVISDNKVIQDYVFSEYGKYSELIAYGGDNVLSIPLRDETSMRYEITSKKYAFKVCRIEPENNLDLILEAFSKLNYPLLIVGNWNNSLYGIELRQRYLEYSNLHLLDPIYEQETIDELRGNCALYIHGHSVGGTNPSLVEAMNLGLCCLVYDVSYNRETTENQAYYFQDVTSLKELVVNFISDNDSAVLDCGARMLEIAQRRYRWSVITDSYCKLID